MYEESLRMPLVMRWPGSDPAAIGRMIAYALQSRLRPRFSRCRAGFRGAPADMQGRSFLPSSRGEAGPPIGPESVYYHYYEYPDVHMVKRHYGVRTKRYKLIHFYNDIDAWELYDLEKDPARNAKSSMPTRPTRPSAATWKPSWPGCGTCIRIRFSED
ncbi:MAG: DUF4976 domain-containing protein [Marinilabiliales bacterium]|nr:DUF4976 domain-containing protein [Marinilabiliales bacterium]